VLTMNCLSCYSEDNQGAVYGPEGTTLDNKRIHLISVRLKR
jgi:hypothetical protein